MRGLQCETCNARLAMRGLCEACIATLRGLHCEACIARLCIARLMRGLQWDDASRTRPRSKIRDRCGAHQRVRRAEGTRRFLQGNMGAT